MCKTSEFDQGCMVLRLDMLLGDLDFGFWGKGFRGPTRFRE